MTEVIEGYSPPALEKKPEDPKNKKPLTIRIILLCDGTNNNKNNIAEREAFETNEKSESAVHKEFGKKDSSYDNGRTNIATMEPHVESGEGVGGYSFVAKVYVQGQGTFNFKSDSNFWGKGMAVFSSGVYQRAREGVNDALALLQKTFLNETHPPEKFFIQQVDVDLFGFSRGAATARHAIHVITTEETIVVNDESGYGAQTVVTNQPLFDRLRTTYGYREMSKDKVKIIFAGLYDTVVSVNASQLMPAFIANNTRSQQAVAKAKFALHLAAADEHRADFPLHRIASAIKAGTGAEYFLPGVHSDIGGSYNLANDRLLEEGKEKKDAVIRELKGDGNYGDLVKRKKELEELGHKVVLEETAWIYTEAGKFASEGRLYAYRQINGLEYARPSNEVDRVINRGRVSDLKIDMENLKTDGWYKEGQIVIDVDYLATSVRAVNAVMKAIVDPIGAYEDGSPKSGRLIVNRYGITSGYCNIPLKFMIEHSRKHTILINAKLDKRIDTILKVVPAFKSVEDALRTYMANKGLTGSKPDDWNDVIKAKKSYAGIEELRHRHLHMSSAFTIPVMDPGFTPRFEGNLRRRFYYEG